ncbi:MAG: peptide ABC transporter ATP-binding protein [Acidobacteria bacterium RIFCSPLOWO2_12_FULL_59_11]|nr:MAG: peptide ABC transporter ATP-binding protein [Acidobacteria bacterium RIFCSPLOWO2_12_FULL_59_11]
MPESPVLSLQDLKTYFFTRSGTAKAVDGVSLDLSKGETLGIVGESGSGKSVTCLSVLRLVPPPGRTVGGKILFEGRDLLEMPERELRQVRGKQIGMVFQDPMTSLNPFLSIGDQVAETLLVHERMGRRQALRRAAEVLEKVGISEAASRLNDYPHRFSGGMRQRVMIASALIGNPKVLIADEPTTALDVTIQAQVLELFRQIKADFGVSIVLVTHNLGIVAGMADHVAVMYAGRVVEYALTEELFSNSRHPYTLALLETLPRPGEAGHNVRPIPGAPPDLMQLPPGCSFYDRCPFHEQHCLEEAPPLLPVGKDHLASCWVNITTGR